MKRLLVIMLIVVAVGVVSAGTIQILTDMKFCREDITLLRKNFDLGQHEPYRLVSGFNYNPETSEITGLVEGNNLYWVIIHGNVPPNLFPCEINEEGIDFRPWNYVIIEKLFFSFPVDPGTPITQ